MAAKDRIQKVISSPIPADLAALGFQQKLDSIPNTMFMTVRAKEKSGKTHFALHDVPQPIYYLDIDHRADRMIQEMRSRDTRLQLFHNKFDLPDPAAFETADALQKAAVEEWGRFANTWYAVLDRPGGGTVVPDTWSEYWELIRMAEFGKLTNVKPHHYTGINAIMNRMLDKVRESDKNVILLQKLKPAWVNEQPTGEWVPQGFSNTPFKVDTNCTLRYDDRKKEFVLRIDNCGLPGGMDLAGTEYEDRLCNFAHVATKCFPGTELEDWGG